MLLDLNSVKVFRCIINAVHRIYSRSPSVGFEFQKTFRDCSKDVFLPTASLDGRLQNGNHSVSPYTVTPGIIKTLEAGNWPFALPTSYTRKTTSKGKYTIRPSKDSLYVIAAFYWKNFEGVTNAEIKRRLGGFGYKVSENTIGNLLRNPIFAGLLTFDGRTYQSGFRPIITPEVFNQVQEKMKKREYKKLESACQNFPLNGLVRVLGHAEDCLVGYLRQRKHLHYYYKNSKKKSGYKLNMTRGHLHSSFNYFFAQQMKMIWRRKNLEKTLVVVHKSFAENICHMAEYMDQERILSQSLLVNKSFRNFNTSVIDRLKTRLWDAESQKDCWKEFQNVECFVTFGVRLVQQNWLDLNYELQRQVPLVWFPDRVQYDPLRRKIVGKLACLDF